MKNIPFIGNFDDNPLGVTVGIMMMLVLFFFLSSYSGVSPISNSSISNQLGCNTCGPGGTPAGLYGSVKWLGIMVMAFLPIILIVGMMKDEDVEEEGSSEGPQRRRPFQGFFGRRASMKRNRRTKKTITGSLQVEEDEMDEE